MEINLFELLEDRPISHPSQTTKIEFDENERLSIHIFGRPWWEGDHEIPKKKKIVFRFTTVSDACILLDELRSDTDESLEGFEIQESEKLTWATSKQFSIYLASSLKDPLKAIAVVENYIREQNSSLAFDMYLNCGSSQTISEFFTIVESASCLLGCFPEQLADAISEVLENEKVEFSRIESATQSAPKYFVRFGGSHFFCEEAIAIVA